MKTIITDPQPGDALQLRGVINFFSCRPVSCQARLLASPTLSQLRFVCPEYVSMPMRPTYVDQPYTHFAKPTCVYVLRGRGEQHPSTSAPLRPEGEGAS